MMRYTKDFETKHQLLTWRQFATIENQHYRILKMDLDNLTVDVVRLES